MALFRFVRRVLHVACITSVAAVLLIGTVTPSAGQGLSRRDGIRRVARPVAGRYVVTLRETRDPDTTALALQGLSRGRVRHIYRSAIRGFAIDTSEVGARALAADPDVLSVEEDGVVSVVGWQSLGSSDSWGLDRIDQRFSTIDGVSSYDGFYRYAADGTDVHAYVIDTGIRTTHTDFAGRAVAAYDVIGDGNGGRDCHGHGTHVAGTVGGDRFGVAKRVKLYSVRVFTCDGLGTFSGVVAAIDWVTNNHVKPAVINMSIGGGASEAINAAIRSAISHGVTVVGAAGNEAEDSCVHLMGGVPEALVVGASGHSDGREAYSNYGGCVDLFAPGGQIMSSYSRDDSAAVSMSGTSMAVPHVAGAAALYLQRRPGASPAQVAAALIETATVGILRDAGAGSPNRLLFTAGFGDTLAPTVSLTRPFPGATLRGSVTVSAAVQDDVEVKRVVFFAGDVQLGVDSTAPYSMDWNTVAWADGPYSIVARAEDLAGNQAAARVSVAVLNKRDETPPRLTLTTLQDTMLPPNGKMVAVSFSGTAFDDVSTIRTVWFTVRDEYGRVQPAGYTVVQNGRFFITTFVEASRRGHDADGRQYVLTVTASDAAGNRTSATGGAIVIHDRRSARR